MTNKTQNYQPFLDEKGHPINVEHYDPDRLPPSIKLSEQHMIATRIAEPVHNHNGPLDEASGLPIDNKLLPICCDNKSMNFLSPGFPMYFQFIKFSLVILFTIMLTSGVHNAYTFYYGSSCQDTDEEFVQRNDRSSGPLINQCNKNFVNLFTIANRRNEIDYLQKSDIYNFFTITTLLLILQFIRKIQKQTAIECDERQITASDFTARVINLPRDFTEAQDIDEEIRKFFEKQGCPGTELNVQEVSVCYDCSEKSRIKTRLKEAKIRKLKLQHTKAADVHEKAIEIDNEIKQLESDLKQENKRLEDGVGVNRLFEGEAYVTFETQQELHQVLNYWKLGFFQSIREKFRPNSVYKFRGKLLQVVQAPEPSDINWENAGVAKEKKFIYRVFTNLLTLGLLVLTFAAIFETNKTKVSLLTDLKKKESEPDAAKWKLMLEIEAVTLSASLIVVTVNFLLKLVLKKLVKNELHSTQTEFQASLSMKVTIAQLFNTIIVIFIVYTIFGNIAGPGGLTYTIFLVFITNALAQWALVIFDPSKYYYYFMKWKVTRDKEPLVTQKQLHEYYRLPEFDFPLKYANYAKTTLAAAFFAPLIPIVVPIAFFGLAVEYWLDKHKMLRKSSRGPSIGPELPFEYVEFLEYSLVLYAVGNFVFNVVLLGNPLETQVLTVMGFIIGLINAFLPMSDINEALFPTKDEVLSHFKYSEKRFDFLEDYARSNPATEEAGRESFIKRKTGEHNPHNA